MALGRHWEWRAFGTVSSDFRRKWESLDFALPDRQWHDMVDRYLWVPGYGMNVKLRSGPPLGDCLKFKRLRARWNHLQLWHEDPEDVHCFPLEWSRLSALAKELHIQLNGQKRHRVGLEEAVEVFARATPPIQIIEVHKHRQPRIWQDGEVQVLVEIAEISQPEPISSLCLESTLELTQWSGPDQMVAARESVQRSVVDLEVENQQLKIMNYVDALGLWADGKKLADA
jgi:hypothetical protein